MSARSELGTRLDVLAALRQATEQEMTEVRDTTRNVSEDDHAWFEGVSARLCGHGRTHRLASGPTELPTRSLADNGAWMPQCVRWDILS
jgi:hypothetical protein